MAVSVPISGPPNLTDSTAVVTGAAGAIGTETCAALAREGATIVATDIDEKSLAMTSEQVRAAGEECTTVQADITDPDDIAELREVAGDSVDLVVTTHGIIDRVNISEMTLEHWRRTININLTGTMLTVQAFYNDLRKRECGKIVCIGSIAGQVGGVISGPDYVASKAGVHGLVMWLAQNGASDGVYANGIAPGPVWTSMTKDTPGYDDEMTPLNRLGEPEDIAEAVVFLGSQQSNWITGIVLNVNGGSRVDQ